MIHDDNMVILFVHRCCQLLKLIDVVSFLPSPWPKLQPENLPNNIEFPCSKMSFPWWIATVKPGKKNTCVEIDIYPVV